METFLNIFYYPILRWCLCLNTQLQPLVGLESLCCVITLLKLDGTVDSNSETLSIVTK